MLLLFSSIKNSFITENHQTKTKYNDALVMKLFGFQFVNSYASLIYIAFFREVSGRIILNIC